MVQPPFFSNVTHYRPKNLVANAKWALHRHNPSNCAWFNCYIAKVNANVSLHPPTKTSVGWARDPLKYCNINLTLVVSYATAANLNTFNDNIFKYKAQNSLVLLELLQNYCEHNVTWSLQYLHHILARYKCWPFLSFLHSPHLVLADKRTRWLVATQVQRAVYFVCKG